MKAKIALKKRAQMLRKRGYSINEIYRKLDVAKSSVSEWVRDVHLSSKARARIEQRWTKGQKSAWQTRRNHTEHLLLEAKEKAERELMSFELSKNSAKVLTSLMYWCEGAKEKHDQRFTFTNSDPILVATFLSIMRNGFDLNETKFRVCIHVYGYHNPEQQLLFWSRVSNIPLSQFIRPYRKPNTGIRTRDGYQGCASISYHDVKIAREVLAISRAFFKRFGPIS